MILLAAVGETWKYQNYGINPHKCVVTRDVQRDGVERGGSGQNLNKPGRAGHVKFKQVGWVKSRLNPTHFDSLFKSSYNSFYFSLWLVGSTHLCI